MKKMMPLLVGAMLVVMALGLVACGGGSDKYKDSEYLGEWKAGEATYAGFTMDVSTFFEKGFSVTLEADGSATANVDGESASGTWEETSTGFALKGGSTGDLEFKKIETGKVSIDYEGVSLVFVKS